MHPAHIGSWWRNYPCLVLCFWLLERKDNIWVGLSIHIHCRQILPGYHSYWQNPPHDNFLFLPWWRHHVKTRSSWSVFHIRHCPLQGSHSKLWCERIWSFILHVKWTVEQLKMHLLRSCMPREKYHVPIWQHQLWMIIRHAKPCSPKAEKIKQFSGIKGRENEQCCFHENKAHLAPVFPVPLNLQIFYKLQPDILHFPWL